MHASKDSESSDASYTIKVLLGKRDSDILEIYARQLVEDVARYSCLPLLLAVALKDESMDTLKQIVALIQQNRIW